MASFRNRKLRPRPSSGHRNDGWASASQWHGMLGSPRRTEWNISIHGCTLIGFPQLGLSRFCPARPPRPYPARIAPQLHGEGRSRRHQGVVLIGGEHFQRSPQPNDELLIQTISDKATLTRLIDRIKSLATQPRPSGSEKLAGRPNHYRVRQGNYRVIYSVDDQERVVEVVKVGHRRDVYR
jgi:mRNA interferase RelE/StbE